MNITVVGLGAMGRGIAHSLLRSEDSQTVTGYDINAEVCRAFHDQAQNVEKVHPRPNAMETQTYNNATNLSLSDCVFPDTNVVVLVLVNEDQCQSICFGNDDHENNDAMSATPKDHTTSTASSPSSLLQLLPSGSTVILCSTVSPQWALAASHKFSRSHIEFVDCPVSGGPARAMLGDLSLMASGSDQALQNVTPILHAMGGQKGNAKSNIHYVGNQAGKGSTVKMIHQLLAGVHIVAAAEALSLAAKAGIDPSLIYNIVKGAAGNSWMFEDRGKRMIRPANHEDQSNKVLSSLAIFIKDLSIVHSEAQHHRSPIPLASAALQQFISGAALGFETHDDSSVVRVYETLAHCKVATSSNSSGNNTISTAAAATTTTSTIFEGSKVGDYWVMEDGSKEQILEVGQEPRHKPVLSNAYTRVLRVSFPPNDSTFAHRHSEDSLYFFLVEGGLDVINHVQGSSPKCDCMEYGEVRYGTHRTNTPLVHKITNKSNCEMLAIDAEILTSPPITCPFPLVAEYHTLIKTRDRVRVYKLTMAPGRLVTVSYPFFHLTVVLSKGDSNGQNSVKTSIHSTSSSQHGLSWTSRVEKGHVEWHSPRLDITIENVGDVLYEHFVVEWL